MCDPLTADEDAVYREYLKHYLKDGRFTGDIAGRTAESCNMSCQRAQAAVRGLIAKGKISFLPDAGEG